MNLFTHFRNNKKFLLALGLLATSLLSGLLFLNFKDEGSSKVFNTSKVYASERLCYQNYKNSDEYSGCMVKVLDKIAEVKGVAFSVGLINQISDRTSGMHNFCHATSHAVGEFFYIKYSNMSYTGNYASCSQGYAHGLLQGAASRGDASELSKAILKICGDTSVGTLSGCLHGASHAAYDAKMPLKELEKTCEKVIPQLYKENSKEQFSREQINCIEGWPMELASYDRKYFLDKKNLVQAISVCSELTGYYKFGCSTSFARQYINETTTAKDSVFPEKLKEYREFCSIYKEEFEVYLCDFYLGSAIGDAVMRIDNFKDKAATLTIGCGEAFTANSICLHGFANNVLSVNGNNLNDAKSICSFMLTQNSVAECMKGFQEEAKTYNR